MTATVRGKPRSVLIAIPLGTNFYYCFQGRDYQSETGFSATDTTALGHLLEANFPSGETAKLVFSPQSPKPARYRKKINANPTGTQIGVMNVFGDGSNAAAMARAGQAGWRISKPQKGPSASNNGKSQTYAVELSNGLLYFCKGASATQITEHAATLGLKTNFTGADFKVAIAGCQRPHPPSVTLFTQSGTVTMSCSHNKVEDAMAAGWTVNSSEVL